VTELLAIVLCGAAGCFIGGALIQSDPDGRLATLRRRGRIAGAVVLGSIVLFVIAGLIEGLFRQVVHDVTARYALAGATSVFWFVYFGAPRRPAI